jgi:hypothetical protein
MGAGSGGSSLGGPPRIQEKRMSKSKVVIALCLVAFAAACAPKTEEVVYVDEPVSVEPTYTGKYK